MLSALAVSGSCVICAALGWVSVNTMGRYSIDMLADISANSRSPYWLTFWLTPGRSLLWHPSPDSQSTCRLMCWATERMLTCWLTDRPIVSTCQLICLPIHWPPYQSSGDQHIDWHVDQQSTDTWYNGRWCQTILSWRVHKLHKIPLQPGYNITLTSTLIILDITKTSSNNCL